MSDLFYPTIDLFIYDFIEGLGDDPKLIQASQEQFLSKIPEYLRSEIKLPKNLVEKNELVYLFPNAKKGFVENFSHTQDHVSYSGYYYPVSLGDSYGLLVDCSLDDTTQAKSTQAFKDVKTIIERNLQETTGTIGQTWLISGWLPPTLTRSQEDIAKACYRALMPHLELNQFEFDGEGTFLGATIFEIYSDHFPDSDHVVIILYPDQSTLLKLSANFLNDWMSLFYYRHKILWSYHQSSALKKSLKKYFFQIQARGESIHKTASSQQELSQLRQILIEVQNTLNNYTIDLPKLELQKGTIEINLGNYKKRLEKIEQKAKRLSQAETHLNFCLDFSDLVSERYLLQVQKDSENLERGLKLLENTINAVRSRVEIEKTQIERNFKELVAVVGAGVAGTSLVNSFGEDSEICEMVFLERPESQNWCELALFKVVVTPLILFMFIAFVTWLIRRILRR